MLKGYLYANLGSAAMPTQDMPIGFKPGLFLWFHLHPHIGKLTCSVDEFPVNEVMVLPLSSSWDTASVPFDQRAEYEGLGGASEPGGRAKNGITWGGLKFSVDMNSA